MFGSCAARCSQSELIVWLGVPRQSRRGILEMQNGHGVVLLLKLFPALFKILGFFGLRRLCAGGQHQNRHARPEDASFESHRAPLY